MNYRMTNSFIKKNVQIFSNKKNQINTLEILDPKINTIRTFYLPSKLRKFTIRTHWPPLTNIDLNKRWFTQNIIRHTRSCRIIKVLQSSSCSCVDRVMRSRVDLVFSPGPCHSGGEDVDVSEVSREAGQVDEVRDPMGHTEPHASLLNVTLSLLSLP